MRSNHEMVDRQIWQLDMNGLRFQLFVNRFQKEGIGLVYYPSGIGRGGQVVSFDESISYIEDYATLLRRNARWSGCSAKIMIASLAVAALAGFTVSATLAIAILVFAIGGYVTMLVNVEVSPWWYRLHLARQLERKITSIPMARVERIRRGYAWPYWKTGLFYGLGLPLMVVLVSLRANKDMFVQILGPETAETYVFMLKIFLVTTAPAAIGWILFQWFRNAKAR